MDSAYPLIIGLKILLLIVRVIAANASKTPAPQGERDGDGSAETGEPAPSSSAKSGIFVYSSRSTQLFAHGLVIIIIAILCFVLVLNFSKGPEFVFAAFLPSILVVYLIWHLDRHKEPALYVLSAFFLGAIVAPVAVIYLYPFHDQIPDTPFAKALFGAAIPEEVYRVLILFVFCRAVKEVNEPFDVLVYGAAIWGGFAASENLLYVWHESTTTGRTSELLGLRTALCTTGHVGMGMVSASFVAAAVFSRKYGYSLIGLVLGIGVHTIYNWGWHRVELVYPEGSLDHVGFFEAVRLESQIPGFWISMTTQLITLVIALVLIRWFSKQQQSSETEGDQAMDTAETFLAANPLATQKGSRWVLAFGLGGLLLCILVQIGLGTTVYLVLEASHGGRSYVWSALVTTGLTVWFWHLLIRQVDQSIHQPQIPPSKEDITATPHP